jgi:hypothetical protein
LVKSKKSEENRHQVPDINFTSGPNERGGWQMRDLVKTLRE